MALASPNPHHPLLGYDDPQQRVRPMLRHPHAPSRASTSSWRRAAAIALFVLPACGVAAQADDWTTALLERALPAAGSTPLSEIGKGIGIVFSPDLSVPRNCDFYDALGFACFDSPDWRVVLSGIHAYNETHADAPVRTLILETHGTNGNGLKLQAGKSNRDARSYISVGGLQERLEPDGIELVIISACNSGRLLRPSIYRNLNPRNGDRLFLAPTLGILGASAEWRAEESSVEVVTPASSHIETTLIGELRELEPATRDAIVKNLTSRGMSAPPEFAVSDMLIQMLIRDPQLRLQTGQHADQLSAAMSSPAESERLFRAFVAYLAAAR